MGGRLHLPILGFDGLLKDVCHQARGFEDAARRAAGKGDFRLPSKRCQVAPFDVQMLGRVFEQAAKGAGWQGGTRLGSFRQFLVRIGMGLARSDGLDGFGKTSGDIADMSDLVRVIRQQIFGQGIEMTRETGDGAPRQ